MNTVELRNPQQPEPQPQPGDVYRSASAELYQLIKINGVWYATMLTHGYAWNGGSDLLEKATAGLTHIGPCRITVEQLKGEGKL